jgi:hypothetical protein
MNSALKTHFGLDLDIICTEYVLIVTIMRIIYFSPLPPSYSLSKRTAGCSRIQLKSTL